MAFLVRIAAAKVIARTVWTASRRMFPRVDLPPDLRLVRHKGRYNCHQRSNASVSNTTGAVPPKTIAGSHSRSTRPRRLRGLWSGPISTGRTPSLVAVVFLGMPWGLTTRAALGGVGTGVFGTAGGVWGGSYTCYSGWADYAQRNGIVCTPGTVIKGGDGILYMCQ